MNRLAVDGNTLEPSVEWRGDAVCFDGRSESQQEIQCRVASRTMTAPADAQLLVKIECAGVNPIDAKAAVLPMHGLLWPRVPGRDFAGTVIAGERNWVGKRVWGMARGSGLTTDGTHAQYALVKRDAVCSAPQSIDLIEAGGSILPFVTAFAGLREAGSVRRGQTVVVFGANGKVGQAVVQLAAYAGATVIGVERGEERYAGHSLTPVRMLDSLNPEFERELHDSTQGTGADIAFNTVGSPYFPVANRALAEGGHHIIISTIEPLASIDLFDFYRGRKHLHGIDTLKMDDVDTCGILHELATGFDSDGIKPLVIDPGARFSLVNAARAYEAVLRGSKHRIVIAPWQ